MKNVGWVLTQQRNCHSEPLGEESLKNDGEIRFFGLFKTSE